MLLHWFYGVMKGDSYFCVQVKEDKRTGRKDFMSVFDRKPRKAHHIKISRCVAWKPPAGDSADTVLACVYLGL